MRTFFVILAVLNLANGAWMLLAPQSWYLHLPAAVPDTGPFNAHFVRDIGAAFMTMGGALMVAVWRVRARRGVLLATATFYALHALLHVDDIVRGHLGHAHWKIDLPGVFLPAIVLVVLCLPRFWKSREE
jgi:hypothetical protein